MKRIEIGPNLLEAIRYASIALAMGLLFISLGISD